MSESCKVVIVLWSEIEMATLLYPRGVSGSLMILPNFGFHSIATPRRVVGGGGFDIQK